MRVVFFQFFFYEGRFGEDRDIVVRGSEWKTRKRKLVPVGGGRKTDLKSMMLLSKKKNCFILEGINKAAQCKEI